MPWCTIRALGHWSGGSVVQHSVSRFAWVVHDGRLVAGPGKFKFKCNLFKAVIRSTSKRLHSFSGVEEKRWKRARTDQAASCRKPQDLDNTHRGRSISTKEVNRKLGIAPIAMELGQRRLGWATKIPTRLRLLRELVLLRAFWSTATLVCAEMVPLLSMILLYVISLLPLVIRFDLVATNETESWVLNNGHVLQFLAQNTPAPSILLSRSVCQ